MIPGPSKLGHYPRCLLDGEAYTAARKPSKLMADDLSLYCGIRCILMIESLAFSIRRKRPRAGCLLYTSHIHFKNTDLGVDSEKVDQFPAEVSESDAWSCPDFVEG